MLVMALKIRLFHPFQLCVHIIQITEEVCQRTFTIRLIIITIIISLFLGKPGNVNGTAKPCNYENYPTEGQSLGLYLGKNSVCPVYSS